jgi:hypothetical protein
LKFRKRRVLRPAAECLAAWVWEGWTTKSEKSILIYRSKERGHQASFLLMRGDWKC